MSLVTEEEEITKTKTKTKTKRLLEIFGKERENKRERVRRKHSLFQISSWCVNLST